MIKKNIYIAVFVAMLIVPGLSWSLLSILNISNPKVMEVLDFDLNEKRLKATLSEIINMATINEELENYYNDRIPYRSILITAKKGFDSKIEEPYKDGLEMRLLKIFSKKKNIDSVTLYTEEHDGRTYRCFDQAVDLYNNHALAKSEIDPHDPYIEFPLKVTDNGKVIIGQSDWLYLNNLNIDYYTGKKNYATISELEKDISLYGKLNDLCKKLDKKMIIYICPEKEEIYPEYMANFEVLDKIELPLYIRDGLKKKTDINYIYQKEDFLTYKNNYLLYKKYDSHWNYVGGYLALNEIRKTLGMKEEPLYDMTLEKIESVFGDLVSFGNIPVTSLTPSIEYYFKDYKPDHVVEKTTIVDAFDRIAFVSTCNKGAPMKVFLVGDSYTEAVIPFAEREFQKLYCTSYMNMTKEFIKGQVEDADVLVFVFVERNEGTALKDCIKIATRILQNYEVTYEKKTE